ncbi:MAG: hypothetical protein U5R06_09985 [candidate division KSB1 bacterium]|nr:hypothetical protein [candidate division KSB1 bacterium]
MRQCLMHYAAGVLCFFILLTGCTQQSTQPGQSKWQPFNSGLPQNVSVLTIDQSVKAPQVLYIGTFSGVYKRLPGSDWTSVQSGLPLKHISAVAVHPQNADLVFCGTWGRGLYRSENGGDRLGKHLAGCSQSAYFAYTTQWFGLSAGVGGNRKRYLPQS